MTENDKALATTTPEGIEKVAAWRDELAATVIRKQEGGGVALVIPDETREKFNVVAPLAAMTAVDPDFQPGLQIVKLVPGRDYYPIEWAKKGKEWVPKFHAPNKEGLQTLAQNIATGLGTVDPANAPMYQDNATLVSDHLEEMLVGPELLRLLVPPTVRRLLANPERFIEFVRTREYHSGSLQRSR